MSDQGEKSAAFLTESKVFRRGAGKKRRRRCRTGTLETDPKVFYNKVKYNTREKLHKMEHPEIFRKNVTTLSRCCHGTALPHSAARFPFWDRATPARMAMMERTVTAVTFSSSSRAEPMTVTTGRRYIYTLVVTGPMRFVAFPQNR